VASVRSCQKLPPCLTDPVPAGSKMDMQLAKAKAISDGGSTSGITQLRSGKKPVMKWQSRERSEMDERNNSADTKVSEERGERRCSRHWSRDVSPAACDEDHGEAGCPPTAHGGPRWSRSPPAARGRDPTPEQVDA